MAGSRKGLDDPAIHPTLAWLRKAVNLRRAEVVLGRSERGTCSCLFGFGGTLLIANGVHDHA